MSEKHMFGLRNPLADFLRARRVRTDPADVGLPGGGRRRTPGLRREEVASLAGVSPTWYSVIEQGRYGTPSAQVLDSLADALKLSDSERRYLIRLANGRSCLSEPRMRDKET
jgi:DNA-binding XRE family transcriptional regulator